MQIAWQQLVGMTLAGRFRLTQFLDAGGFGGVFSADETVGDLVMRTIALKLLRPPLLTLRGTPPTPEQRDAMLDQQLHELQLASRLEHPHLIRCYSVGMTELSPPAPAGLDGELLFLVMELGQATLADELEAGPLSAGAALQLVQQLCSVLHYLHQEADLAPLLHGDIKPANVLQVPNARGGFRWKLSDLGTVQALQKASSLLAGPQQVGTLAYAAPELLEGRPGSASDIWALGAMLCEALGGTPPFGDEHSAGSAQLLQQAILTGSPALPQSTDDLLDRILAACFERDPEQRPSAGRLLDMLDGGPLPQPTSARPAASAPAQAAALQPRPASPVSLLAQSVDTHAEAQLRSAVRRALEDRVLSPYERSELNELRKRLDIRLERAAAIFREEHQQAQAPDAAAAAQSGPAASAPPLQPPDQRSFNRRNLAAPPAAAASPAPAAARQAAAELIVDADTARSAPYRRIADAVADAAAGSRILIRGGLYEEHITLDKPLELCGYDSQANVIIRSTQRHALVVNCAGVVLRRLQIEAGRPGFGSTADLAVSALVLARGRLEAEDCRFICRSENAVAVFGATSLALLKRCEIVGGKSVGLSATHDARAVAEHCRIEESGLAAASCANGGHLRLNHCTLQRSAGYGLLVYIDGIAALRDCQVLSNANEGIALKNGGRAEVERCRVSGNRNGGILVQAACFAAVKGCDLRGNHGPAFNLQRGATVVREANSE